VSNYDENDTFDMDVTEDEVAAAAAGGFKLLPAGQADGEVIEAALGRSKAGNPQMVLKIACYDQAGAHLGDVTDWVPLQVPFRKLAMKQALGRPGDPTGRWPAGAVLHYEGRACRVKIKHEEYNGRMTAKVDKLLPPSDAQRAAEAAVSGGADAGAPF